MKLKYNVLQVWGVLGQCKVTSYIVPNKLNVRTIS